VRVESVVVESGIDRNIEIVKVVYFEEGLNYDISYN